MPGIGRTLAAAVLAALAVSLLLGIVVFVRFKDETLDMLLTITAFGTVFGTPYAVLVAVTGPRLARRVGTPAGRVAVWLGLGLITGASILAIPLLLLRNPADLLAHSAVVTMFGGFGLLGSAVLMAMLGRR